jgi:hypothetical protein
MTKLSIPILLVLGATGCPAISGSTTAEDLCVRADDCNLLETSVQECIEYMDRCTDDLTPSQRSDWERQIEDCLGYDSCQLMANCYFDVPWC